MSKKIVFNEEEIKEIIRMYVDEKMGTPSIGEALKVHKAVISRTLKENGVVLGPSGRKNTGGKSAADKRYRIKNGDKFKKYHKEWSDDNREALREYHTEWRKDNKDHVDTYKRDYERNRRATDPKYRLCARTRTAVYTCLKEANVAKYRSTFELLGFTLEELMVHLEGLFTEGMTWDNYGEWHVDHKLPMSSFEFETTDDREFKLCWCLENLQPLWGPENLSKGTSLL